MMFTNFSSFKFRFNYFGPVSFFFLGLVDPYESMSQYKYIYIVAYNYMVLVNSQYGTPTDPADVLSKVITCMFC